MAVVLSLCGCTACGFSSPGSPPHVSLSQNSVAGGHSQVWGTYTAQALDSTIVVSADVTDDAVPDSLIVQVRRTNGSDVFHWSLRVKSQGVIIFRQESDTAIDAEVSGLFGGSVYGDSETFYFHTVPQSLVDTVQIGARNTMLRRDAPNGVYFLVDERLRRDGITSARARDAIIGRVVERLKNGTAVLSIPLTPLQRQFPMIFVPEVSAFVTFYRW